jgi:hypothetical protein
VRNLAVIVDHLESRVDEHRQRQRGSGGGGAAAAAAADSKAPPPLLDADEVLGIVRSAANGLDELELVDRPSRAPLNAGGLRCVSLPSSGGAITFSGVRAAGFVCLLRCAACSFFHRAYAEAVHAGFFRDFVRYATADAVQLVSRQQQRQA